MALFARTSAPKIVVAGADLGLIFTPRGCGSGSLSRLSSRPPGGAASNRALSFSWAMEEGGHSDDWPLLLPDGNGCFPPSEIDFSQRASNLGLVQ
jgi:hypothetical protein